MKFLHLADLHLGKTLGDFDLKDDQRYILQQILEIAETKQVDAVLIAGDVFDKTVPSEGAVQILDEFIRELVERHLQVYMISGNHDSAQRLDYASGILGQKGIYIAGKLPQNREEFLKKVTLQEGCASDAI